MIAQRPSLGGILVKKEISMAVHSVVSSLEAYIVNSDIEAARSILDKIDDWEQMEGVLRFLREDRFAQNSAANYILADIHFRYEDWAQSSEKYKKSGDLGLKSAYYMAALIICDQESHSPESENEYWELIRKSADSGHVWSIALLRKERSKIGRVHWFEYMAFRFVIAPIAIVSISLSNANKDRIRISQG